MHHLRLSRHKKCPRSFRLSCFLLGTIVTLFGSATNAEDSSDELPRNAKQSVGPNATETEKTTPLLLLHDSAKRWEKIDALTGFTTTSQVESPDAPESKRKELELLAEKYRKIQYSIRSLEAEEERANIRGMFLTREAKLEMETLVGESNRLQSQISELLITIGDRTEGLESFQRFVDSYAPIARQIAQESANATDDGKSPVKSVNEVFLHSWKICELVIADGMAGTQETLPNPM